MTISTNSWHARVYLWWYHQKHPYKPAPSTVNLCPYVRVVLFWGPFRRLFLTRLGFAFWPLLAGLLELGLYHFFGAKLWPVELGILGAFAVIFGMIGLLLGLFVGVRFIYELVREKPGVVTFKEVLYARYDAYHSKICPVMQLEAETEVKKEVRG